jgi:hypothetical protein
MIDRCESSPVVGIVSSRSSSSYFAAATSFINDVAARTMQHNNQFGVEAAAPMALMPMMMLIITLSEGIAKRLVQNPTYSYVGHNPQPTHNAR